MSSQCGGRGAQLSVACLFGLWEEERALGVRVSQILVRPFSPVPPPPFFVSVHVSRVHGVECECVHLVVKFETSAGVGAERVSLGGASCGWVDDASLYMERRAGHVLRRLAFCSVSSRRRLHLGTHEAGRSIFKKFVLCPRSSFLPLAAL